MEKTKDSLLYGICNDSLTSSSPDQQQGISAAAARILFQHRTPIDFAIAVANAVAMDIARVL
jgi:hypothetical protein